MVPPAALRRLDYREAGLETETKREAVTGIQVTAVMAWAKERAVKVVRIGSVLRSFEGRANRFTDGLIVGCEREESRAAPGFSA